MGRTITVNQHLSYQEMRLTPADFFRSVERLSSDELAIIPCPCRLSETLKGHRKCNEDLPVGVCLFTGMAAAMILEKGTGINTSKKKMIRYASLMTESGAEIRSDAGSEGDTVFCFCCGCCCSHEKHHHYTDSSLFDMHTEISCDIVKCQLCLECQDLCPADAICFDNGLFRFDPEKCIGCGLCLFTCPESALTLKYTT